MAAHHETIIGSSSNFWLFSSKNVFDLTHPQTPTSPPTRPRLTIETTTSPIIVDPAKSALVIIGMQNFFLHRGLGRAKGAGHRAVDELVQHAIPAARKAGIRVLWVNWGLTQEEIDDMPPALKRAFGFEMKIGEDTHIVDQPGDIEALARNARKFYGGLGADMGVWQEPATEKEIEAGRLLMRDQWNTALYSPLDGIYEDGRNLKNRPDIWIHKNRMSGLWGDKSPCTDFLEKEGIRTLLFTGVNTDQCVGGSLQDAFTKGWDCILLSDGAATTSPSSSQESIEFNCAKTWGFCLKCEDLAKSVERM